MSEHLNFLVNFHHMLETKSAIEVFGEELREDLFPNIPTFFGHIVATIILLFVIVRFGYLPFRKSQRDKHNYIQNQIVSARNKFLDASSKNDDADKFLEKAKIQASKIITQAKEESQIIKQNSLNKIKVQEKKILETLKTHIDNKEKEFEQKFRKEVIDVSFNLAEKIVEKQINKKSMKDTVNNFLDSLESKSKNDSSKQNKSN